MPTIASSSTFRSFGVIWQAGAGLPDEIIGLDAAQGEEQFWLLSSRAPTP
ncbi:hypothetical protein [Cupriavidus taiwanensis]|nr:hypothetical protein [Cupriavidus taiwanensis]